MRKEGYGITWIPEIESGMSDKEVLALVREKNYMLITEDKDFGKWVFAHHISDLTVLFLRYDKEDYETILAFLKRALRSIESQEKNQFITINRTKSGVEIFDF